MLQKSHTCVLVVKHVCVCVNTRVVVNICGVRACVFYKRMINMCAVTCVKHMIVLQTDLFNP